MLEFSTFFDRANNNRRNHSGTKETEGTMLNAIGIEAHLSQVVAMKNIEWLAPPPRSRGLCKKPNA
jgi:hypothetical protein